MPSYNIIDIIKLGYNYFIKTNIILSLFSGPNYRKKKTRFNYNLMI